MGKGRVGNRRIIFKDLRKVEKINVFGILDKRIDRIMAFKLG